MEAHQAAAEFYAEQLGGPEAIIGRQFLDERGFDRAAAERFGVGYAPQDGRALRRHLTGRGSATPSSWRVDWSGSPAGTTSRAGCCGRSATRGARCVGFGARRLLDDDRMPAKYINTPETPLYKKSHVLYGLDLARQQIGRKSQAVVVEGYTDVMAAHLSGVDTAVASCGTAFGDDHARLLRRLMGNHDAFHGEVIFTFDGDAAGQAAAMKVFAGDQNFIAQTYVAVEPTGLDPVRPAAAARRRGRPGAGRPPHPAVPVRDGERAAAPRPRPRRRSAGRSAGGRAAGGQHPRHRAGRRLRPRAGRDAGHGHRGSAPRKRGAPARRVAPGPSRPAEETGGPGRPRSALPDPHDRLLATERETSEAADPGPAAVRAGLGRADRGRLHPPGVRRGLPLRRCGAARQRAAAAAGCTGSRPPARPNRYAPSIAALAVEPLSLSGAADARYVVANSAKLQLLTAMRAVGELKSKLQRTNPVEHPTKYNQMFSELVVLEARAQAAPGTRASAPRTERHSSTTVATGAAGVSRSPAGNGRRRHPQIAADRLSPAGATRQSCGMPDPDRRSDRAAHAGGGGSARPDHRGRRARPAELARSDGGLTRAAPPKPSCGSWSRQGERGPTAVRRGQSRPGRGWWRGSWRGRSGAARGRLVPGGLPGSAAGGAALRLPARVPVRHLRAVLDPGVRRAATARCSATSTCRPAGPRSCARVRGVEAGLTQTLGRTATAAGHRRRRRPPGEVDRPTCSPTRPPRSLSSLEPDPGRRRRCCRPAGARRRAGRRSRSPTCSAGWTALAARSWSCGWDSDRRDRSATRRWPARLALPVNRVRRLEAAALERAPGHLSVRPRRPAGDAVPDCASGDGSPGWTRTNNIPVNSRTLCQLSYRGSRWTRNRDLIKEPGRGRTPAGARPAPRRRPPARPGCASSAPPEGGVPLDHRFGRRQVPAPVEHHAPFPGHRQEPFDHDAGGDPFPEHLRQPARRRSGRSRAGRRTGPSSAAGSRRSSSPFSISCQPTCCQAPAGVTHRQHRRTGHDVARSAFRPGQDPGRPGRVRGQRGPPRVVASRRAVRATCSTIGYGAQAPLSRPGRSRGRAQSGQSADAELVALGVGQHHVVVVGVVVVADQGRPEGQQPGHLVGLLPGVEVEMHLVARRHRRPARPAGTAARCPRRGSGIAGGGDRPDLQVERRRTRTRSSPRDWRS